jgi:cellulose biosynthesis protein BcsQ
VTTARAAVSKCSGKTTTTISLAAVLAERGYQILVVDLAPQASASLWLGGGREPCLYRAIADKRDLEPFVRATRGPRVSRNKQEDSYGPAAWNLTGPGGKTQG